MKILGFDVSEILQMSFFGNPVEKYLISLGVFLGIFIGIRIFRRVILIHLGKLALRTKNGLDDKVVQMLEKISSFFYLFLTFYLSIKVLNLDGNFQQILDGVFVVLIVYEAIKVVQVLLDFAFKRMDTGKNETAIHGIKIIAKILLWGMAILLILDNLGFEIKTLVASLGIGGIAIALAAQNILSDLFSSFTIYFDKPFQIGDYIVIGTSSGTVEKIGLKTTRIRTSQGEELVVSNQELTSARVQNFKQMRRRRTSFPIGIEYGTSSAKMKKLPSLIKKIIESHGKQTEFVRCHFSSFGDSALLFNIVYFVNSGGYDEFMDVQQAINFEIKDMLEKEEVSIAFPTQTIFVKNN
ncbi:mechanosensitive ion channel family protein [Candidatus Gracilibacteria bacterium]|nr:mechanosensitive ion channel family protein [Candidatus Gracilibacteria bacterium]